MAGKIVCVTGASGFIASWLVKMLLERGYTVRGTVRNPEKAKHLYQLPGAKDRLQLLPAELLEPGVFDSAVEGCDGVFHTASPCFGDNAADPQAEILHPAIEGTLNLLRSCAKARTKRIILTSSTATIMSPNPKDTHPSLVDESCWSDPEALRETKNWYALSKVLAERAAWEFVKEHDLDMRVLNPAGVLGPMLQGSLNFSNGFMLGLLSGKMKTFPNYVFGLVGVKDTASAHILLYEKDQAEGRYICSERLMHVADWVALLKKMFREYHIDAKDANESVARVPVPNESTEKLRSLGMDFQPLEEVIREAVAVFREKKLLE